MSKIRLLTIFPFLVIATVANAGTTISDSRYWPSMAHQDAALNSRAEADATVVRRNAGQYRTNSSNVGTYRGGPKTGTWSRQ